MVTVYGASDDLIEIDGDIREEFPYDGEETYLAFSDGTVLSIFYAHSGVWRIAALQTGRDSIVSIVQAESISEDAYSDRARVENVRNITFVVKGTEFARRIPQNS